MDALIFRVRNLKKEGANHLKKKEVVSFGNNLFFYLKNNFVLFTRQFFFQGS